ncbi:MAG TPA: hypothetical protein VFM38_09415 [Candidatus Limnocylindrales bacterium]|nr:hypothetical protein [Candidatus Limnocylindrales bacterium]
MPFGFLRRDRREGSGAGPSSAPARPRTRGVEFSALTEEWRLSGVMDLDGRLTDALNKREPIAIRDVQWAPLDGSKGLEPAPGLKSVDPYDLIVVLGGEGSLPPLTDAERVAHKVHKVPFDVALELPPFRVLGTVYLYPGSEPERLLDRATEMFLPVTDALATLGDVAVTETTAEVVLVNRFYLRGVEQIDRRTGERPPKLPGAPLGGISWQDRAR